MSTNRTQRALEKAERFIARLTELHAALSAPRSGVAAQRQALEELESLVLVRRGSSETDHRQQLTLSGLQAAFERYLAPSAPQASAYAASADQDALLSAEALRELRGEYPDEADAFSVADVAAAVRSWAQRFAPLP